MMARGVEKMILRGGEREGLSGGGMPESQDLDLAWTAWQSHRVPARKDTFLLLDPPLTRGRGRD